MRAPRRPGGHAAPLRKRKPQPYSRRESLAPPNGRAGLRPPLMDYSVGDRFQARCPRLVDGGRNDVGLERKTAAPRYCFAGGCRDGWPASGFPGAGRSRGRRPR